MQVKLFLNSAFDLKNVNWRYGDLQPYAIAWIDSSGKCSTKIDVANGVNPVWNEKFTITLPTTSHPQTAILCIDIVHAITAADMKPLVGSAKLSLGAAINEVLSKGKAKFSLIVERPSGRPQGNLDIQIEFSDLNNIQMEAYRQQPRQMPQQPQPQPFGQQAQLIPQQSQPQPYGQQAQYIQQQLQSQPQPQPQPYMQQTQQPQPQLQPQLGSQPQLYGQQAQYLPSQPQLQSQPRPQPQPYVQQVQYMQPQLQPQPRPQLWQMNQYPRRPGYPINLPQNVRPGNAMMMQNTRPQNSAAAQIGDVLCTLAIGVTPRQIGRMVKSFSRTFQGPQQANGMLNNTTIVGSNNANVTTGNYPAGQQGYDNTGYDATGTYNNYGYEGVNYGDGQFGTDAGYADGQFCTDGGYADGQFCTDGVYADGGYADEQFSMDVSGLGGCDDGGFDVGFGDGGFDLGSDF